MRSPKGGVTGYSPKYGSVLKYYPGGQIIPNDFVVLSAGDATGFLEQGCTVPDFVEQQLRTPVERVDVRSSQATSTPLSARSVSAGMPSFSSAAPSSSSAAARPVNVEAPSNVVTRLFTPRTGAPPVPSVPLVQVVRPEYSDAHARLQARLRAALRPSASVPVEPGVGSPSRSPPGTPTVSEGSSADEVAALKTQVAQLTAMVQDLQRQLSTMRAAPARAPKGGLVFGGKIYGGGQFIPKAAAEMLATGELVPGLPATLTTSA